MIGEMLVKGLAAGAYVIGLLFTLTLFALVVYGVCCLFAWAFGEEEDGQAASLPEPTATATDAAKGKTWNEIERRYVEMEP